MVGLIKELKATMVGVEFDKLVKSKTDVRIYF